MCKTVKQLSIQKKSQNNYFSALLLFTLVRELDDSSLDGLAILRRFRTPTNHLEASSTGMFMARPSCWHAAEKLIRSEHTKAIHWSIQNVKNQTHRWTCEQPEHPQACQEQRWPSRRGSQTVISGSSNILRPLRITSLQNKKRLFENRIRMKSKVDKYSQCILQHSGCVRTASQEAGDDSSCRSALFRDRHPRPSAAHESRAFCEWIDGSYRIEKMERTSQPDWGST